MKHYLPCGLVSSGPASDLSVAIRQPHAGQPDRCRSKSSNSRSSSQILDAQLDLQLQQLPLLPGFKAYMKVKGEDRGHFGHPKKSVNSSHLCVANSGGTPRPNLVRAIFGDLANKLDNFGHAEQNIRQLHNRQMEKDQNNRMGQQCVEKKQLKIETGRREDMRRTGKPPENVSQGKADGNAEFHARTLENLKMAKDQNNRRAQQFVEEEKEQIETDRRRDMRRAPKLELERCTSRELVELRETAQEDGQRQSSRAEGSRNDEEAIGQSEMERQEANDGFGQLLDDLPNKYHRNVD